MNFERLLRIDRKVIFVLMGVAIVIPLAFPFRLPVGEQPATRGLFDTIERIDPAKQALMVGTDWTPQTEAENQPMTVALIRHGLARKLRVVVISFYNESMPMADQAVTQVIEEYNSQAKTEAEKVIYGRDVVMLGWVPPPIVPILGMGQSITGVYKVDNYGASTDTLAIMKGLRNYDDIGLVCVVSGGSMPQAFIQFAQPRYGVKIAAAVTAVSAPDLYAYIESGQLSGMLSGMKGAAEYEYMIEKKYHVGGRQRATEGMGAQSIGHLFIMALVIMGNIGYFVTRRKSS
jgi:hypothetical protein